VWERNKQASRVVLTESETLVALHSVSAASGIDDKSLRTAIRAYVLAVIEDEWPRLADQERSPRADAALNALLREVAQHDASQDAAVQGPCLDLVFPIPAAHENASARANDRPWGP